MFPCFFVPVSRICVPKVRMCVKRSWGLWWIKRWSQRPQPSRRRCWGWMWGGHTRKHTLKDRLHSPNFMMNLFVYPSPSGNLKPSQKRQLWSEAGSQPEVNKPFTMFTCSDSDPVLPLLSLLTCHSSCFISILGSCSDLMKVRTLSTLIDISLRRTYDQV